MSVITALSSQGYAVGKTGLTKRQMDEIKADLVIDPNKLVKNAFGKGRGTFPVYRESATRFYLPFYYGVGKFGQPQQVNISKGQDIHVRWAGSLRDYQQEVMSYTLEYLTTGNLPTRGLLELPCSWGKTTATLYLISQILKKTLIIVNQTTLLHQWIERIQQFLPNAKVGIIQGDVIDVEGKDIVIAMLHSLCQRDYELNLFKSFGFTVIDEVHHISSETFSNALFKVVSYKMLGLSATMERKDGTTSVFKMFLGDVIRKVEKFKEKNVQIRAIQFSHPSSEYNEVITMRNYQGKELVCVSAMITKLCSFDPRTNFICKTLVDFLLKPNIDINEYNTFMINANKTKPMCSRCCRSNNYVMKTTCCGVSCYCRPCGDILQAPEIITIYQKQCLLKMGTETATYARLYKKYGNVCRCESCVKTYDPVTRANIITELTTKRKPKCLLCNKLFGVEQNEVINPFLKLYTDEQVIILSHQINLLDKLYALLVDNNYASVGYFVGGMEQEERQKSTKKSVILATFQIASENLDISTLTSAFFVTPKTDIIQSEGRIGRTLNASPVIYDFVDSHQVFKNQWNKRKTYYVSQKYNIITTTNAQYTPDITKWKPMVLNARGRSLTFVRKTKDDDSGLNETETRLLKQINEIRNDSDCDDDDDSDCESVDESYCMV